MQFDVMAEDGVPFGEVLVPLLIEISSCADADSSEGDVLLDAWNTLRFS